MTRYAITKIDKDGLRSLATANQGRYFHDTPESAETHLRAILSNNSYDTLKSVFGDVSKMEVRPVDCYETGDAKGIYFDN